MPPKSKNLLPKGENQPASSRLARNRISGTGHVQPIDLPPRVIAPGPTPPRTITVIHSEVLWRTNRRSPGPTLLQLKSRSLCQSILTCSIGSDHVPRHPETAVFEKTSLSFGATQLISDQFGTDSKRAWRVLPDRCRDSASPIPPVGVSRWEC